MAGAAAKRANERKNEGTAGLRAHSLVRPSVRPFGAQTGCLQCFPVKEKVSARVVAAAASRRWEEEERRRRRKVCQVKAASSFVPPTKVAVPPPLWPGNIHHLDELLGCKRTVRAAGD